MAGDPVARPARTPPRGLAGPSLVFALTFVFQLPFFDRWFSAMDEGHMLQYADLVAHGGQMYRDATSYPLPGAFYLLSLVFRVFEPSIRVARYLVVLEFAVFVAVLFVLMRRLVPVRWAVAGVGFLWLYRVWAFPHWQMYSYSTTALLVLVIALWTLVRFFETGSKRTLLLSGVLVGLGVFCKQDYGAQALLAQIAALAVYVRTAPPETDVRFTPLVLRLVGGAGAVGLAAGAYFAWEGILSDVVQMTVLNYFRARAGFELSSFPSLFPIFVQDPALRSPEGIAVTVPSILWTANWAAFSDGWLFRKTAIYDTGIKLFLYGPHLLVAAGLVRLWRRRRALRDDATRRRALCEVALFALAAFFVFHITVYRPQDWVHLAVLYWPLPCLLLVYAHAFSVDHPRAARAAGLVASVPLLAFVVWSGDLLWKFREIHSAPVPSARAGIFVAPAEAEMLGELVAYVKENSEPGQTVAIMPYFPILHFLTGKRAPQAASYIVWPFAEWPDRDRRIIEAMDATAAPVVVYNFTQFLSLPSAEEFAPELFEHLVEHYEIERLFQSDRFGYKIAGLRRKPEPSDGRAVVEKGAANAVVRIVAPDGRAREITGAERDEWVATTAWPFRRVLALRPTMRGRTVLSVPVDVPEGGATLRTAIGMHPDLWFRWPPFRVGFAIAKRDGERGREVLFEADLSPQVDLDDRGWHPVEVSLDRWAGRRIELEFSTYVGKERGEDLKATAFAEPRVVPRDASG